MNCEKYKQWITDRLAGELTPEQDKLLTLHLKQCDACRKYAAETEKMWQSIAQTFAENGAKTEKMTQARLDAIRSEFNSYIDTVNAGDERVITFREQHKRRFMFHAIAACVVCVLIAIVVMTGNDKQDDQKKDTAAPAAVAAPASDKTEGEAVAEKSAVLRNKAKAAVVEDAAVNDTDAMTAAEEPVLNAEAGVQKIFAFAPPDDMTAPEKQMFRRECAVVMSPFVPDTLVCCSVVIPGKRLKGEVKLEFVPVENFAVTPVKVSSGNALIFAYHPVAQPLQEKNKIRLILPNGRKLPFPVIESVWVDYAEAPAYLQLACLIHTFSAPERLGAIRSDPEMRRKVLTAMEDLQKHFAKDPARFPLEEEYKLLKAAQ